MNDAANPEESGSVSHQRKTVTIGVLISLPLTAGLWLALRYGLPPIQGVDAPLDRLLFALKCCCVAVLLCFLLGIEAVAHERLHSKAINPLIGEESARMKVNLRYLQHTLEQLMLFIPGLLSLSHYCSDGRSMRAVAATTIVWIVSRGVFWIGYHKAPRFRAPGLSGMLQSIVVLLYVCGRFGHELAGVPGAVAILLAFVGAEIYLIRVTRRA